MRLILHSYPQLDAGWVENGVKRCVSLTKVASFLWKFRPFSETLPIVNQPEKRGLGRQDRTLCGDSQIRFAHQAFQSLLDLLAFVLSCTVPA